MEDHVARTSRGEKLHSHRRLSLDMLMNGDQYMDRYPTYLRAHVQ